MNLPSFLTTLNGLSGVFSIMLSIEGHFLWAAILMLIATALDFSDGLLARHLSLTTDFGKQLDSLCDAVSFGIAPAVFGFCQGLKDPLSVVILALFAAAGLLRLARFNVSTAKGFIGLPITTNGYLIPALFFIHNPFSQPVIIVYLVMMVLMVSTIRIPKVTA
jgi:CDP-diacylglycerol---serine O-phosphatidyltransferase